MGFWDEVWSGDGEGVQDVTSCCPVVNGWRVSPCKELTAILGPSHKNSVYIYIYKAIRKTENIFTPVEHKQMIKLNQLFFIVK